MSGYLQQARTRHFACYYYCFCTCRDGCRGFRGAKGFWMVGIFLAGGALFLVGGNFFVVDAVATFALTPNRYRIEGA
jgi:hypothetical protein